MSRPVILLIHGAWHGAWCWKKLVPLLAEYGHDVIAPDLPGHGADYDASVPVTLETYTAFVKELIQQQPRPVVLVGHSMSGIIISQVAESIPERIERLVYLTAYLLEDGQTILELAEKDKDGLVLPNLEHSRDRRFATVRDSMLQAAFYHDCRVEDVQFARSHLVPQSLAPLSTPVSVSREKWGRVPRSYIECTADRAITHRIQKQMQAHLPCDPVMSLDTSHSVFLSAPVALADILHSIITERDLKNTP